jgi:hypothetical protein
MTIGKRKKCRSPNHNSWRNLSAKSSILPLVGMIWWWGKSTSTLISTNSRVGPSPSVKHSLIPIIPSSSPAWTLRTPSTFLSRAAMSKQLMFIKKKPQGLLPYRTSRLTLKSWLLDLDPNGRVLLGHMNGDISEYEWNSSSVFTDKSFNVKNKFPATGSKIYGVKSCPNE